MARENRTGRSGELAPILKPRPQSGWRNDRYSKFVCDSEQVAIASDKGIGPGDQGRCQKLMAFGVAAIRDGRRFGYRYCFARSRIIV